MEILAIIPARGGSKGLVGKNIKMLLNHPLIAYSIKAAQESKLITRLTVNTDDENIATIARNYGAEIPFMRPEELGGDTITDLEVFKHQLAWHAVHENYIPNYVVQLRPTSPFRKKGWIDTAITELISSNADSLRSITPAPITPFKMWTLNDAGTIDPLLNHAALVEPFNEPRQKLPQVYWQTGTIDIIKTSIITEQNVMSGKIILPFLIANKEAIDIDNIAAFNLAAEYIEQNESIKFD